MGELRKVAWPARTTVLHNAAICLCVLVIVTLLIVSIDVGWAALLRAIGV